MPLDYKFLFGKKFRINENNFAGRFRFRVDQRCCGNGERQSYQGQSRATESLGGRGDGGRCGFPRGRLLDPYRPLCPWPAGERGPGGKTSSGLSRRLTGSWARPGPTVYSHLLGTFPASFVTTPDSAPFTKRKLSSRGYLHGEPPGQDRGLDSPG